MPIFQTTMVLHVLKAFCFLQGFKLVQCKTFHVSSVVRDNTQVTWRLSFSCLRAVALQSTTRDICLFYKSPFLLSPTSLREVGTLCLGKTLH